MKYRQPIIECVPNFSEGRDPEVIEAISRVIDSVAGVTLMHVDPGADANRTVMTFAGAPEAVVKAAFEAIRVAAKKIDMRIQSGEHPRIGATDVCPLIPVANIAMEEVVQWANELGHKVGSELGIPVFMYEASARVPERKNLAHIRSGEYEGLEEKLRDPHWKPDYGPYGFNAEAGATVIGARDFLLAYNVNLNTTSVSLAKAIAAQVRESGRTVIEGGKKISIPGLCKSVKAIGWYMEAYQLAQVSMNLTNFRITPLHEAFETCREVALKHGVEVTGSELIGMVPLQVFLDAGRHFAEKKGLSINQLEESELIDLAVRELGLDFRGPFDARERIIEYCLEG